MMRGDFGGDRLAIRLGPADQLDAPGGADVLDVITAADRAIQQQIAGDHQLLGFGGCPGRPSAVETQTRAHGAAGEGRVPRNAA